MTYVDIKKIIKSISEIKPCGIEAELTPLFEKISYFRQADEEGMDDQQGWSYQPKKADWLKVKELCIEMLSTQSKDLQILCWLTQALTEVHGLSGAKEGVFIIDQFIINYWDEIYPLEEDFELREGLLMMLDRLLSRFILMLTFDNERFISLFNWKRVQIYEKRVFSHTETKEHLLNEGYISLQKWIDIISSIQIKKIEEVKQQCIKLRDSIEELNETLQQKTGKQWNTLSNTKENIKEICELFLQFHPDESSLESMESNECCFDGKNTPLTEKFPTEDFKDEGETTYLEMRKKAIKQLENIIILFRENEPLNPIPYLLERAIRWSDMNTIDWMADIFYGDSGHYNEAVIALLGPKFPRESGMIVNEDSRSGYPVHSTQQLIGNENYLDKFSENNDVQSPFSGVHHMSTENGEFNNGPYGSGNNL
jgi:type VI secretion system protein ImpA